MRIFSDKVTRIKPLVFCLGAVKIKPPRTTMKKILVICCLAAIPIINVSASDTRDELRIAKQELSELLLRYTDSHPKVEIQKQKIARLEQKKAEAAPRREPLAWKSPLVYPTIPPRVVR